MTAMRKLVRAEINTLGDDEVEVVMSTASLARDGHILLPQGCVLDNYRANPITLWSHDPDQPVGNAEDVEVGPEKIRALVRFAPLGISAKADEVRGLVKAGVIRAVSVGFDPIEGEPLDPKRPRGGQRISAWELLELSFVSVPSDVGAVVTQRANGDKDMDEPQGEMKPATRQANVVRAGPVKFTRGLYQVAQLCYMFEELGWQVDSAKWEAACEGDASKVPGMLGDILAQLGDALMAMTAEEVAEALAGRDIEIEDDGDGGLIVEERAHVAAGASPAIRAFRRGIAHAKVRAGKTLSAETVRCLRDAKASHEDAMDLHRSAMRKHKAGIAAVDDMLDRSGVSDPDSDTTKTIQKSDDVEVDDGSRADRDFRTRQADLLALSAAD